MQIGYDVPSWFKGVYQDKAPVRTCARPWKMVHEKQAEVAVVCCHGFTGYPGELGRPGSDLYDAGFDVWAMRYSGHGTSQKDFLATSDEDWLDTARNCMRDITSRYDKVYLVGHSMGGSIAIILASEFPVERMALIAPALDMKALDTWWKRTRLAVAHPFIKKISIPWKSDPDVQYNCEFGEDDDAYLGAQYWSYLFPRQSWDLYKLAKEAKRVLPSVKADTLSLSGGLDKAVWESSSVLVTDKPMGKNKHLHIPKATHLMPYDKDKVVQDQAMYAIRDWMLGR